MHLIHTQVHETLTFHGYSLVWKVHDIYMKFHA